MLEQLNIHGKTKLEMTLDRLKRYEPEDGYFLAFSGGKDSVTIKALAGMAGVKYEAVYNVTSIDPPELVQFVKTFDDVKMNIPRYSDGSPVTMWNLIPKKKMPPTRLARYCCQYLKEGAGLDRFRITGIRWAESSRRQQNRGGLELSNKKGESLKYDPDEIVDITPYKYKVLNPIIDWTEDEVWDFIKINDIRYCSLYDEGFKRLGCIGCPMSNLQKYEIEERWPTYKQQFLKAFDRMLDNVHEAGLDTNWKDAEDVYNWWLQQE